MHSIAFHTFLLSLLHLLVDGVCACGLMMTTCQIVSDFEAYGIIVLYDVLAFGTQPLAGRWVDSNGDSPSDLKLAMALLVGGSLISLFHVSWNFLAAMPGIILLGLGNSLFHVYGGKYVAMTSHNDIRVMGVFVSTGSVGLALGLGFSSPMLLAVFILTLLALSVLHLRYAEALIGTHSPIYTEEAKQISQQPLSAIPILYLSCLMLVVAGRSFIGESVPTLRTIIHSMGTPLTMVMVGVIVLTGKAAGGFLSQKWRTDNLAAHQYLHALHTLLGNQGRSTTRGIGIRSIGDGSLAGIPLRLPLQGQCHLPGASCATDGYHPSREYPVVMDA